MATASMLRPISSTPNRREGVTAPTAPTAPGPPPPALIAVLVLVVYNRGFDAVQSNATLLVIESQFRSARDHVNASQCADGRGPEASSGRALQSSVGTTWSAWHAGRACTPSHAPARGGAPDRPRIASVLAISTVAAERRPRRDVDLARLGDVLDRLEGLLRALDHRDRDDQHQRGDDPDTRVSAAWNTPHVMSAPRRASVHHLRSNRRSRRVSGRGRGNRSRGGTAPDERREQDQPHDGLARDVGVRRRGHRDRRR